MFFSRGLQIGVYCVILNAVLVAASLLHRKIIAVDPPKESSTLTASTIGPASNASTVSVQPEPAVNSQPIHKSSNGVRTLPSQDMLEQFAPSIVNTTTNPVSEDDPLMAEIRKQLAEKLPELSVMNEAENPDAKPSATQSLQEEQLRKATIGQLSSTAEALIRLAQQLHKSGKHAEAEMHLEQAKQIQAQIKQLAG